MIKGKGGFVLALMLSAFTAQAQVLQAPLPDTPTQNPPTPFTPPPVAWPPSSPPVLNVSSAPQPSGSAKEFAATASLPTEVGRIPYSFSVGPAGTADYTIPIVTPPGVGNVHLNLALRYSSRGPDGLEGMGWSITGLSSITRCNKTYAQDGAPSGVLLTQTDRVCLDGKQLKLTSGTAPNYVIAGNQYATEIEAFSQVTSNGSGSSVTSFTVKAKDGLIYTYGGTADSEIFAGSSGVIRTWALSKIADRAGNSIAFVYQNDTTGGDTSNGSYRIDHISYPYLAGGGGPFYAIEFNYGSRPAADVISAYFAGYLIQETHQLNNILVEEAGGALIKEYNLGYTPGPTSGRQTLTAIQECSSSSCLPGTSVSYQAGSSDWIASTSSPIPTNSEQPAGLTGAMLVDLNSDGKGDAVYEVYSSTGNDTTYVVLSTPTGYASPVSVGSSCSVNQQVSTGAVVGTFEPNGRHQLICLSGSNPVLLEFNGTSITETTLTTAPQGHGVLYAMDVDGDGLTDLVYMGYSGSASIYVQRNTTTSSGNVTFAAPVQVYSAPSGANFLDTHITSQMDFNGDGRADVLLQLQVGSTTSFVPLLSNGTNASGVIQPFTVMPGIANDCTGTGCVIGAAALDWNGDGCTDFVQSAHLYISNCAGGFVSYALPSAAVTLYPKYTADFNGDGRQDIIYKAQSGSAYVIVSNGGDPATATTQNTSAPVPNRTFSIYGSDVDGDGLTDIIFALQTPPPTRFNYSFFEHNGAGSIPDLATTFTDGYGLYQRPTYVPITASAYAARTDAVFPEEDYTGPLYVVSSFLASDGAGSVYQDQFYYYGARLNVQGRGSEGFYTVRTYDSRSALFTYEYNKQLFPYTGMPWERVIEPSGGPYVSVWEATVNEQTLTGLGGKETRWFPYVFGETTNKYEVGGAKSGQWISSTSKSTQYSDGYGNPTTVTTSVTDEDSTSPASPFNGLTWTSTVVNTFDLDTTDWCLSQPLTRAVTNAVPGQTTQTRNTSFSVDGPHCRISERVDQPGPSALTVTTDYFYDTCGGNLNKVNVTGHNPDGSTMATRTTLLNYAYTTTRCQLPEYITNALTQSTTIGYNYDFGVVLSSQDPNGITTSWSYDDYGRLSQENRPDGTYSKYVLGACNSSNSYCGSTSPIWMYSVTTTDYPVGGTPVIATDEKVYDSADRVGDQMIQGPLGHTITKTDYYDSLGRLIEDDGPHTGTSLTNGSTTWLYDSLNRPTTQTMCCGSGGIPLNAVTTFKYLGQTRSVTDPLTNTVQHVYDVAGRLRQTIDPAPGATTKYDYDVFGNLNKTTDAIGKVSSATFNLRGFRTQMVDADAGTWNFSGDSLNELVGWSDANTNSFSQTFDALGRRTTRTEPEGTSTWVWGSTASMYNIGSLYQVYGLSAEEIYDYDSVGRLSDKTVIISGDQSYLFNYSYNSIGALDKVTYPTSPMPSGTGPRYEIEYAYSYGYPYQIQDITNSSSPVTIWTLGSVNDYFSPLTETIGWGSGAAAVTHSYLPSYNFVSTIQSGTGGSQTNMQNLAYSWDADGNLLQRQSLGTTLNPSTLTEHFTPDTLNRISSSTLNGATNLSMSYDAAGDILTKSDVGSYTYGNASHPHAVMGAGSNSYTYDANGNIKTRNGLANTWASFNLPTELQSSVSGTTLSTQFWYGPEHERVRQMATDLDGVESTYYVGDSLEKMIATTTNLTYWRHYVHTPYGLSIVVSRNSNLSSSASLVLDDHLGSSDAIVNDANGSLFVQESFDAFGQRRQSNWAAGVPSFWDQVAITEASRRGFTGHEQLDNVGLIHMNGRVYDPVIGRFLSVDPISGEPGDSQRLNPYAYVRNRPLTLTDPSGLDDRPLPPFSEDRLPYIVPGIIFIWGPTANQNDTSGPGNPVNPSAQSITQPQQPVNESNGQTTCCTYKPDSWISKDSFVNDDPGLHEIVVLAHKLVDFSVESWQGFARSGTIQRDEEGRRHFSLDNALFMASMMSLGTTTAAKSAIETVVADATATAAKQAAETAAGQQLETVVVQAAKGLTNAEVRAIYAARVRLIDTSGPLTRATAERVHAARNALKVELRAMMANREEAAALEQTNPIQPFEFYVQKYTSEGLSGESLWQRIIQGGTTPNAAVNSRFGVP